VATLNVNQHPKKRAFLEAYAKVGIIGTACRHAGINARDLLPLGRARRGVRRRRPSWPTPRRATTSRGRARARHRRAHHRQGDLRARPRRRAGAVKREVTTGVSDTMLAMMLNGAKPEKYKQRDELTSTARRSRPSPPSSGRRSSAGRCPSDPLAPEQKPYVAFGDHPRDFARLPRGGSRWSRGRPTPARAGLRSRRLHACCEKYPGCPVGDRAQDAQEPRSPRPPASPTRSGSGPTARPASGTTWSTATRTARVIVLLGMDEPTRHAVVRVRRRST
jgi:hypothetical protein